MNLINEESLRQLDGIKNVLGSNYDVIVWIRYYLISQEYHSVLSSSDIGANKYISSPLQVI